MITFRNNQFVEMLTITDESASCEFKGRKFHFDDHVQIHDASISLGMNDVIIENNPDHIRIYQLSDPDDRSTFKAIHGVDIETVKRLCELSYMTANPE